MYSCKMQIIGGHDIRFRVEKEIVEKIPNACFGVVMAKNIDNSKEYLEIEPLLTESIQTAAQRFEGAAHSLLSATAPLSL